ncbi:MAG: hypothetical protein AAGE80_12595 [Pseudomonadota bacterium]
MDITSWGFLEWFGVVAGVCSIVGLIYALIPKRSHGNNAQEAGDRGVNIAGDNSGNINTGSQTTRSDK